MASPDALAGPLPFEPQCWLSLRRFATSCGPQPMAWPSPASWLSTAEARSFCKRRIIGRVPTGGSPAPWTQLGVPWKSRPTSSEWKGVIKMESSDQKDTSGQLNLEKAGDQNAGIVTVLHIVIVLMF